MSRRLLLASACLLVVLLGASPAFAGWTHYWRWLKRPDDAALTRCIDDMSRLADARRALLVDAQGRTGASAIFRDTQSFPPGSVGLSDAGLADAALADAGLADAALADAAPADAGLAEAALGDAGLADAGAGAPLPAIVFNGIGDAGHEAFGFPLAPFTSEHPLELQFVKTAHKPYDVVVTASLIAARDSFPRDVLEITSDGTWPSAFADGAALYERTLGRRAANPLGSEADAGAAPPNAGAGSTPDGDDASASASTRPARPARKNLLLGVIFVLALAIVFVMTRETRA
jgi:hypothetical protein